MKTKFQNLILFTCLLVLSSCSSDDDNSGATINAEGTWTLSSLSIETAYDFNENGTATKNLYEETTCFTNDYVKFNADGSARVVTALADITTNISTPPNYTYSYQCLSGYDAETTWVQTGNTVTIDFFGSDLTGTISGSTMTVIIPDFFEIERFDGTDYYEVKEDVTLVYIK